MSWDILSDFWDDYEYKDVVNTIWNNYEDLKEEQMELLKQIDNSKSIQTVPYDIKRKWKKIIWEVKDGEFVLQNDLEETITRVIVKRKGQYFLQTEDYQPLILTNEEGEEIKYKIDTVDIPFEEKEYNPLVFRDIQGNKLTPEDFDEYIENGRLITWAKEYYIHNNLVYKRYGELLGLNKSIYDLDVYSKRYYNIVRGMWYVYVNGPTIQNLKIGTYLLLDLPIVLNDNVRIEEWYSGWIKLDDGTEWYFNKNFRNNPNYFKGMSVPKYTFLVDALEIKDYKSHPGWWEDYYYFNNGEDIEKFSTVFFHLKGASFFNRMRDMTVLRTFLDRLLPQFVNLILFVDTTFDDGDTGEPGDPGDEIIPGDPDEGEDDDQEGGSQDPEDDPHGPGDDKGDDTPEDEGSWETAPGSVDGVEDAGAFDGDEGYYKRPGKLDPWFEKLAEATIADGPVQFRDYPDYHPSYALQMREYKFDGEIRFDNLGDELEITAVSDTETKKLTTY